MSGSRVRDKDRDRDRDKERDRDRDVVHRVRRSNTGNSGGLSASDDARRRHRAEAKRRLASTSGGGAAATAAAVASAATRRAQSTRSASSKVVKGDADGSHAADDSDDDDDDDEDDNDNDNDADGGAAAHDEHADDGDEHLKTATSSRSRRQRRHSDPLSVSTDSPPDSPSRARRANAHDDDSPLNFGGARYRVVRVPAHVREAARSLTRAGAIPPPLPPDVTPTVVVEDDVSDTATPRQDAARADAAAASSSSESEDLPPHPPRLPPSRTDSLGAAPAAYEASPLDGAPLLPPTIVPYGAPLPWDRDAPPSLDSLAVLRFQGFHNNVRSHERFLRLFGDLGAAPGDRLWAEYATQTRCHGRTYAGTIFVSSRFFAFVGCEFVPDAPPITSLDDSRRPMRLMLPLLDIAAIHKARIAAAADDDVDDKSPIVLLSRAGAAGAPLRLRVLSSSSVEFSALLLYTTTHVHVFAGFAFPDNVYAVIERCWRRQVDRRGLDTHPLKAQLLSALLRDTATTAAAALDHNGSPKKSPPISSPAARSPIASPVRSPASSSPPPAQRDLYRSPPLSPLAQKRVVGTAALLSPAARAEMERRVQAAERSAPPPSTAAGSLALPPDRRPQTQRKADDERSPPATVAPASPAIAPLTLDKIAPAAAPVSPSTPYGGIPGNMSRRAQQDAADGVRSPVLLSPRTSLTSRVPAAAVDSAAEAPSAADESNVEAMRKMQEELSQMKARLAQLDGERSAAAAAPAPAPAAVDFWEPLVELPPVAASGSATSLTSSMGGLKRLKSLLGRRKSAHAPAPPAAPLQPTVVAAPSSSSIAVDIERALYEVRSPPPALLAFVLAEPPPVAAGAVSGGGGGGAPAASGSEVFVAIDGPDGFDAEEWSEFERRRKALMAAGSGVVEAIEEAAAAAPVAVAAQALPNRFVPLPPAQGSEGYLPPTALAQSRAELANRLVMQEQDHVIALQLLLENYMQPCLSTSASPAAGCVPDATLRVMFANVPALLAGHRALLKTVTEAIDSLSKRGGRVLLERLPMLLALARTYTANLPRAKAAYSLAVADQRFTRFVRRTFATSGQELANLMLEPIRMIFVCRALLFSWLTCTPADHADRAALIECYLRVTDTLDHIHELDKQLAIFPEGWLGKLAKANT
jgi:hypothetical protein